MVYTGRMHTGQPFHRDILSLFGPLPRPDSELQQLVYREQQTLLVRQCLNMGFVNIFNGLLVAIVFVNQTPLWKIAAWYLPILAYGLGQMLLWLHWRARPTPEKVSGRFLEKAERTSIFMGLIWGSSILILPTVRDSGTLLFLMLIHGGMAAGVASLLTTLPRLVVRFAASCLTLTVLGVTVLGSHQAATLITITGVYGTAILAGSIVSYRQLVQSARASILVDITRADLADAIASTRDAFSILDDDGRVVMANARHAEWFGSASHFTPHLNDEPFMLPDGRWLIANVRPMSRGGRVCMHTDVTVMKRRERELIQARQEAEAADDAKSRFLNTMSHELRSPLNAIIGFSRLMAPGSRIALSPEQISEYAEQIHTSADHLLCLINDIIDYSKIGLDTVVLDIAALDTLELVNRIIALVQQTLPQAEDVTVSVDIPEAVRTLQLDETAMRRILMALVSNAVKFHGGEPRIVIRAGISAEGRPFITVRDFGIGMSEEQVERAFEAFFQASSSLGREFAGTGLGLTLARHLARQQGGEIILKSRLGAGTSATFLMPAAALIQPPDADEPPVAGWRRKSA